MSLHKKRRQRMKLLAQANLVKPVEMVVVCEGGRRRLVRSNDIYVKPYAMPKTVYVLAPGPNGVKHYKKIPANAYVIAVNSGVMIPVKHKVPFTVNAWMVADKDAVTGKDAAMGKDWWNEANQSFNGSRIFSLEVMRKLKSTDRMPVVTFVIDKRPDGDFMRSAGTVAGCAITFCHINGVKNVVLCGVDMSGNDYFDGSSNPDETWKRDHGVIWTGRDILDERIRYLRACGMSVSSLSKTKLKEVKKV